MNKDEQELWFLKQSEQPKEQQAKSPYKFMGKMLMLTSDYFKSRRQKLKNNKK
jgi:hypothetical protein